MSTQTEQAAPVANAQALATAVEKYNAVIDHARGGLVERDIEIDLMYSCLPAGVHPLFIGLPGTAKSQMIDDLIAHIEDAITVFSRLLAKDTLSEEILGPPNLAALERGSWERVIDHKIQQAIVAFLDEIFKCNSTVLNALLKIIHERIYENNGDKILVPLKMLVGASNELPGSDRDDLRAFRDRFGICKIVDPVRTDEGRLDVLDIQLDRLSRGGAPDPNRPLITLADLALIEQAIPLVKVPDSVRDDYVSLQRKAEAENLIVSPRRTFEGLKVAMSKCVLRGSDTLASEDLAVFQHNLWTDPEDIGVAYDMTLEFAGQVAKKAAKMRTEFEPILAEINELKPQLPSDGNISQELAGSFARVNMLMKNLSGRVDKQIEDAKDERRDATPLVELAEQIKEQREYVRDDVLGFGM